MRRYILVATVLAAVAAPAAAQTAQPSSPDFFFGRPHYSVALRSSLLFPRAGSDIFDFVTDQLTLGRQDFRAPAIDTAVGFALSPRVEIVGGVAFAKSSASSEYRRFVDNDRLPIVQHTSLQQANVDASVRVALLPRGREVSSLAWIPRGVTPYVGAGGGVIHYKLAQSGDFVDFVDLSVFTAHLLSSGWAPSAHAFAGVDVRIWRHLFLTIEGRYQWADADLGQDFSGFDPIDLSGARASAGINVVF